MLEYVDDIENALRQRCYYVALSATLCVPDIAGALETDGAANQTKYAAWFDRWVAPQYRNASGTVVFDGNDCYYLRCALVHAGTTRPRPRRANVQTFDHVYFVEPGLPVFMHMNMSGTTVAGRQVTALNLDLPTFCADMLRGARNWHPTVSGTANYQQNYQASFRRHPNGVAPHIVGVPVYG